MLPVDFSFLAFHTWSHPTKTLDQTLRGNGIGIDSTYLKVWFQTESILRAERHCRLWYQEDRALLESLKLNAQATSHLVHTHTIIYIYLCMHEACAVRSCACQREKKKALLAKWEMKPWKSPGSCFRCQNTFVRETIESDLKSNSVWGGEKKCDLPRMWTRSSTQLNVNAGSLLPSSVVLPRQHWHACLFPCVLAHPGCCNKSPQTGELINRKNVFLTVLGAGHLS